MSKLLRYGCGLVLALPLLSGCRLFDAEPQAKTTAAHGETAPANVTLEVFFAQLEPLSAGPAPQGGLWNEIDEQQIDAAVRRRLAVSGMRVGVAGPQLPGSLAAALKITDVAAADKQIVPVAVMESEPKVTLRVLQTRSGKRNEVVASKTHEEMSLLTNEGGQVCGRTYSHAEGRFALVASRQDDGRTKIELTPEVHYGQQRPHWVGEEGMLRFEPGRPRKVFSELSLSTALRPGQMLVLSSLADRPGSLGWHFFKSHAEASTGERILVIRLAQSSPDGAFAPAEEMLDLTVGK